jgi:hypothetical protein
MKGTKCQLRSVQMVKCAAVRSKHFKASIALPTSLAHIMQLVLHRCGACNDDPDEGSKLHPACESRPGGEFSENAAAQRSNDVFLHSTQQLQICHPRLDCSPLFFLIGDAPKSCMQSPQETSIAAAYQYELASSCALPLELPLASSAEL